MNELLKARILFFASWLTIIGVAMLFIGLVMNWYQTSFVTTKEHITVSSNIMKTPKVVYLVTPHYPINMDNSSNASKFILKVTS